MTKQNYFPEWVMAGTVLADTNVFARTFDQEQWAHAFGLQLTPGTRAAGQEPGPYTADQWWFGTPPRAENSVRGHHGNVRAAVRRAPDRGPEPHARHFRAGMYAIAPQDDAAEHDRHRRHVRRARLLADRTTRRASTTWACCGGTRRRTARTRPAPSATACTARQRRPALPAGPVADRAAEAVRDRRAR